MAKRKRKNQARSSLWLHGRHAVMAALANPARHVLRLVVTAEAERHIRRHRGDAALPGFELASAAAIARILARGAVHQGVAAKVTPLPPPLLEDCLALEGDGAARSTTTSIVVLDQVTDPRNVGAILRSAAAFGAAAVIMTDAHAPPESGTLAKAASGALEAVPLVRVANLSRALEVLARAGYWRVGLDPTASADLASLGGYQKVALVLGAEGAGMRRLTREHCDMVVRLPISKAVESLNVSATAAVALYALSRRG